MGSSSSYSTRSPLKTLSMRGRMISNAASPITSRIGLPTICSTGSPIHSA